MKYRWFTTALIGAWFSSSEKALEDALRWGQATLGDHPDDGIVLRIFTAIEVRDARPFAIVPSM